MSVEFHESQFARRPRKDQMPVRYELERVPAGGLHGTIILSGDVLGTDVHWDGRNTKPCLGDACVIDHAKKLPYWRGYLFVWKPRQQEIICTELTAATMAAIDEAYRLYASLRGCKLNLTRLGDIVTGRMKADVFSPVRSKDTLPDCPSLREYLCRVWQMKYISTREVVTDEMIRSRDVFQRNGVKVKTP